MEELKGEAGEGVEFIFLDAYQEENERVIEKQFKGEDHGALVRGKEGQVIWTAPGHKLTREQIRQGIEQARQAR